MAISTCITYNAMSLKTPFLHPIYDMDMNSLGETLRNARKQHRLTQADLSERVGISRATLSGIENGTVAEIGIRKVMALCSALGLELAAQPLAHRRPTLHTLVDEAEQRKTGRRP